MDVDDRIAGSPAGAAPQATDRSPGAAAPHHSEDDLESFAGGEILVRHGKVNLWLVIVYFSLFLWAIYYLFAYWGGLGPGLEY
jgi:hypothetical protein